MLRPAQSSRHLTGSALADALRDSRGRTWALVADLSDAQWLPPAQRGVNPVAWELGHLAWFAEFWILRGPHHCGTDGLVNAQQVPRVLGPDALFDSARLAHAQRWQQALPSRGQLHDMLHQQLQACVAAIDGADTDAALYFHRLALFHEDMHGEAFCWLRAALGYAPPAHCVLPTLPAPRTGLSVTGGDVVTGQRPDATGFVFDNESPGQSVRLADFEIDSTPVSSADFARFVDAGGYHHADYWPGAAGQWRTRSGLSHPQCWRPDGKGHWQMRWFDQWLALPPDSPVIHVNAFEAQAWCRWAGRALPSAAQWEHAALTQAGLHWGHSVWEWTADAFAPYPGFAPGPYRDYSAPWFGDHRELRGGAIATHSRMHHPRYRNFFQPHRSDVFAGFRTVSA
jgi:gamma-glutamyl hercynylcysteine S-oxide synthase